VNAKPASRRTPVKLPPRVSTAMCWMMAAHSSGVKPGFVSFEGYLAGRLAIEGLERSGQAVDRVVFLENLLDGEPFNLGGVRLRFSERRNQGSDRVYVNLIAENGQIRTVQTLAEDP